MATTNFSKGHWVNIKCPFFHSDNFNSVSCEGVIPDSAVRFIFPNKMKKDEWQRDYCNDIVSYRECPLCKIAEKKYDL